MIINVRKLPVIVSAIQWTGENLAEVLEFTGRHPKFDEWFPGGFDEYQAFVKNDRNVFKIKTLEGTHEAKPGDWIMRGVNGEHYPCDLDIFEKTYRIVDPAKEHINKLIDETVSTIVATLPRTREHSLAVTNLEQAKLWLNA